ncbi:MAG: Bug family tripartite tricarboxylate transporter substrate binding protein [Burkholderiales bacterium]
MHTIRVSLALLLAVAMSCAQAQTTGRVVVGFAAGGALDAMSRVVADALREGLNQPFISDNRAGAEGRIAIDMVKSAAADGNTLLFSPIANFCIYPHTQKHIPYDPLKDFIPVSMVGAYSVGMAVGPLTPAKTLQEFVAWARANPKQANFGTPGNGNIPHFTGILLSQVAGIEWTNVPYKGSVPAIVDLIGGQSASVFTTLGDFTTQARAGKLRVLAHSSAQRSSVAPDVPTFREQGYNIETAGWYALFAPAGVPQAMIERIGRLVMQAQQTPAVRERMQNLSLDIHLTTPAQFAEIVRNDYDRWGKIIRASGFKAVE